jgi:hypothetical protein
MLQLGPEKATESAKHSYPAGAAEGLTLFQFIPET